LKSLWTFFFKEFSEATEEQKETSQEGYGEPRQKAIDDETQNLKRKKHTPKTLFIHYISKNQSSAIFCHNFAETA